MKKIIRAVFLLTLVIFLVACSNTENTQEVDEHSDYIKLEHCYDYVMKTNVYEQLDSDWAYAKIADEFDHYFNGGGCTAVGKTTSNGLLIGRNMDLFITNKPSFIVRTNVEGLKKTFGLAYSYNRGEDYELAKVHGVNPELYKLIPFLQTDVLNEDGFYIEINMRYADYDENGDSIFSCSGTNPGKFRINSFLLPQYLGSRCSTVDEAVAMATNDLDIYTPMSESMDWNFCFMMADASGKYGIMEIAKNKVVFNEAIETDSVNMPLGACQANYYITPEFNAEQRMKSGVGRVDYLRNLWGEIDSEQEMFVAMLGVSYFQNYLDYCQFDNRSEFIGIYDEDGEIFIGDKTPDIVDGEKVVWDYEYVTNPDNQEHVKAYMAWINSRILTRRADDTYKEIGQFWESTYTMVVNPSQRTMFVRFNENNKNMLYFKFDEWDNY